MKRQVFGILGALLLAGAVTSPVAFADDPPSRVMLLNGLPAKVDVCFGRREIVSKLKYGRAVVWDAFVPGSYRFVIREARVGSCTGRRIGTVTRTIPADDNVSLVIWRPNRKLQIRIFENDVTLDSVDAPTVSIRHAATQPLKADVWLWEHVKPRIAATIEPTINDLLRGGSDAFPIRPGQFYVDIYPSHRNPRFVWEGYWGVAGEGTAWELYLIGTAKKNYRIVGYAQEGVVATP